MRVIERANKFKQDYKRESKGRYRASLAADLAKMLATLAADIPLEPKYHDHEICMRFLQTP